ncbi:hypothetical protein Aperf_G00000030542 [Anoplocephala perfoliata]
MMLLVAQESREPVYDLSECGLEEVLDLSFNKIKVIPDQINENQIQHVSSKIADLLTLEDLYLDGNPLEQLPVEMGQLKRLKHFTLPSSSLTFPPQDICNAGISAVLSYLRKNGEISCDDEPDFADPSISNDQSSEISPNALLDQGFDTIGLDRRKNLHQQMQEELNAYAELAKRVVESRVSSMKKLAQAKYAMERELETLQKQRDEKRKELVSSLSDTLKHADSLIKFLHDRQRVHLEDSDLPSFTNLPSVALSDENRRVVLESMNAMLAASESSFMRHRDLKKNNLVVANSNQDEVDPAIQHLLNSRQVNQAKLAAQVAIEESEQMKAFECLQQQNDQKRRQIVDDIHLVETELCRLTLAEQDRKARQGASTTADFSERRKDLVYLLAELQKQKDLRESELHKRLVEMEKQKTRDQTDYWLVLYQRLIDKKPALFNKESFLSDELHGILSAAGAEDFLPNFEYHRITPEMLPTLTDEDLIKIGVTAIGVRKAILEGIVAYRKLKKDSMVEPSAPPIEMALEMELNEDKTDVSEVSPPPPRNVEPSAPPTNILARFEAECCICQDDQIGKKPTN